MTDKATQEAAEAEAICAAGWRQGSVVDPRRGAFPLPDEFALDEGDFLIVCTQSCSVVSPRFASDPLVELMVAKPIERFNRKAPEATGKNQRRLHLLLPRGSGAVALECDINKRFFCDRKELVTLVPLADLYVGEVGAAMLATWMGRAYTRIALPNQLVDRLRIRILPALERSLSAPYGPIADPVHFEVPYIYLRWEPRADSAEVYAISLQLICTEAGASEVLEEALESALAPFENLAVHEGIRISAWTSKLASETFLTDLDGYERFSEWDYLSNLVDSADLRQ